MFLRPIFLASITIIIISVNLYIKVMMRQLPVLIVGTKILEDNDAR
jgi:hypothetical protein